MKQRTGNSPGSPKPNQSTFTTNNVYKVEFAADTDRGLVREMNQDVARVIPKLGLALVADGMGGHEHGDIASRTVADALEGSLKRFGGAGHEINETAECLKWAFRDANQRLTKRPAAQGRAKMGTTLVAAMFAHGHVAIGNVGDSRCYRLRNGTLELLTEDHSIAAQVQQSDLVDPSDKGAISKRWAHLLTRCLNGDADVEVDTRILRCEPGDLYLLCSDGLWGNVGQNLIRNILSSAVDLMDACETLIGAACAGGGADNIAVALARLVPLQPRVGELLPEHAADQPPA